MLGFFWCAWCATRRRKPHTKTPCSFCSITRSCGYRFSIYAIVHMVWPTLTYAAA
jgi:hypothetical protein